MFKIQISFFIIYLLACFSNTFSQSSYEAIQEIQNLYNEKSYYTALNLCKNLISQCQENPTDECWITNYMKEVYRFKGLNEYEIYKKELSQKRLSEAINSLKQSYDLYHDAELLYMYGYLSAYQSVLQKKYLELDGLIDAWAGILELYGNNNWELSPELNQKAIAYIKICEHFDIELPQHNYFGSFAKFMIVTTCQLLEKGTQDYSNQEFIIAVKKKYRIIN